MIKELIQVIVLFFVIIDPFASFAVFFVRTRNLPKKSKLNIALLAVVIAALIAYTFLLFGDRVLNLFNTDIEKFRIAGGIILVLLGINMSLGKSTSHLDEDSKDSTTAIATIIATPLLAGPATITAAIISGVDHGKFITALAIGVVIVFTGILLYLSILFEKLISRSKVAVQLMSTILGLITLAWGVDFILTGLNL